MTNGTSNHGWRCYYEDALSGDRWRYDTSKASNCYHEDSGLALENFANQGKIHDNTEYFALGETYSNLCEI